MNNDIVSICKSLSGEAGAIINYTARIATAPEELRETYEHIRMNEVEHIQQLCIALTREIVSVAGGEIDETPGEELPEEPPTIAWEGDKED